MKKLKSAEEYVRENYFTDFFLREEWSCEQIRKEIKKVIRQVQIDTIEATVERCAEEAKFRITENALIEEGELYDMYDDGVYTYSISNNSILNVAIKIKEELENE